MKALSWFFFPATGFHLWPLGVSGTLGLLQLHGFGFPHPAVRIGQ